MTATLITSTDVCSASGDHFTREVFDVPTEALPSHIDAMRDQADAWEEQLAAHPDWSAPVADPDRPGRLLIPAENLAAMWLYRDWDSTANTGSMEEWASTLFPTARALFPLQRVGEGGQVLRSGELDARAAYLFSTMLDGIALRSRARVYEVAVTRLAQRKANARMRAVSLGCGACVPNIDVSEHLENTLGMAVDWDMYDLDTDSLELARLLVSASTVTESTFHLGGEPHPPGVCSSARPRSFARAFARKPGSVDLVDALGLWEYLSDKVAASLARRAFRLLAPGGALVVSNMLSTRPQRHFNQRAVGWPGLYLRDDEALMRIFADAGLPLDHVTLSHSTDGVYVVATVVRP